MTILFSAAASYFILLWNCNNFNITLWSNTGHVWGRFQGRKGLIKIWSILKHKVHIYLWFWYTINPLFIKFMLLLQLLNRFSRVRLCNPRDSSPPGSPVPGILQARTLEWVAISFSSAWKWKGKVKSQSCPTPSDPMDCSPPGSSVHGICQARVLEWVAIAFSTLNAYLSQNTGKKKNLKLKSQYELSYKS